MIVGVIRRKPVLTYASIVCDMLASVNSVLRIQFNLGLRRIPCGPLVVYLFILYKDGCQRL